MSKIAKQAAGYVHFEKTNYRCDECYKFNPDRAQQACAEVAGKIQPYGSCNTFVKGDVSQVTGITLLRKLTQLEAGYAEHKPGYSCARCEYFNREEWDCKKVDKNSQGPDIGHIAPQACCNFFEPHPVFGEI